MSEKSRALVKQADEGQAKLMIFPVIVGEDRHQAGLIAEEKFGPHLHLLDDGFQHRSLARDYDIVMLTPDDARDRLLPLGRLREPLRSLQRADVVVLTSGASPESFPLNGKTVWRVRRGILPKNVPPRPVVFCGIARPKNFVLQLRTAGIEPVAEAFYRDPARVARGIRQQINNSRATSFDVRENLLRRAFVSLALEPFQTCTPYAARQTHQSVLAPYHAAVPTVE